MLSLLSLPRKKDEADQSPAKIGIIEKAAAGWANLLITRSRAMSLAVITVLLIAIGGTTLVHSEFTSLGNFPAAHPFVKASSWVNERFQSITSLMIVIDTEEKDGIKNPEVLQKMDDLATYLRDYPGVGSVRSVTDFIKQMHRVMHQNSPDQYRLPKSTETEKGIEWVEVDGEEVEQEVIFTVPGQELVAQYLTLYEMSGGADSFSNMLTWDASTSRMSVLVSSDRATYLDKLSLDVSTYIKENFGPLKAELTGMVELMRAINQMIITGQAWSISASLLLVLLLTAFLFRSIVLGIFAATPLFFSLFLNFGLMGLVGVPINLMTMATSAIAIGVGIDYAIHFIHAYQRAYEQSQDPALALKSTMTSSGVAIFLNAITVAAGFSALMVSEFTGVRQIGGLITATMLTSAFAALTILPLLFLAIRPKALSRQPKAPAKPVAQVFES